MQIKVNKFTRGDAQTAMEEWLQNYPTLPTADRQYAEIRNNIQKSELGRRQTKRVVPVIAEIVAPVTGAFPEPVVLQCFLKVAETAAG